MGWVGVRRRRVAIKLWVWLVGEGVGVPIAVGREDFHTGEDKQGGMQHWGREGGGLLPLWVCGHCCEWPRPNLAAQLGEAANSL